MPVNSFSNYHLTWSPKLAKKDAPIYLTLASLLETDILTGRLPRGVRLPPQRELADYLDVDFTTVTRAYNVCKEKNLIYGITGRGTFVSPAPLEATPLSSAGKNRLIDFSTVAGFRTVSNGISEAIKKVASSGHLDNLFSYSNPLGSPHQLAAGRHLLATNMIEAPFENIAIFAGAQNALAVSLFSMFSPGDAIATDPYTYPNLIGSARIAHIKLVPVEGDGNGMKPDVLERQVAKYRIKGLFIMPNAANPTGITITEERREALAAIAKKRSLIVIEDDISPFAPSEKRRSFFSRLPDSTIYIAAYTAFFAPGLRITYAAFPGSFRNRLVKGLSLLNIKAGSLDAEVISELVLSGAAREIMDSKRKIAKEANAIFDRIFRDHSLGKEATRNRLYPFFRTISLPGSTLSGPKIEEFFLSRGMNVMHSYRFAVGKAVQHDFIRISISSLQSMKQLEAGLNKLSAALSEFKMNLRYSASARQNTAVRYR
ncbi:MAG: PLP-dependent aminotransferase family protein [Kiritimatiellae bacterium]|nr:PLP-dependent aminotransferase family protein [Kiritimatiellia bacterium]